MLIAQIALGDAFCSGHGAAQGASDGAHDGNHQAYSHREQQQEQADLHPGFALDGRCPLIQRGRQGVLGQIHQLEWA